VEVQVLSSAYNKVQVPWLSALELDEKRLQHCAEVFFDLPRKDAITSFPESIFSSPV
jgi:hypothetical protein